MANAVAIQTNGEIIAAGYTQVGGTGVARYNPNGSLDTSFGSAGQVRLANISNYDPPGILALQGDGKMLVSGKLTTADDFALARLNSNGSLDTGFGNAGEVAVNTPVGDSTIHAWYGISLQSDGRIVTVGGNGGVVWVNCFNPNGSLDTSFARNGWQAFFFNPAPSDDYCDSGLAVAVQPWDGKIVVAGAYNDALAGEAFGLARLNPDGSFDGTPPASYPQIGSLSSSASTWTAGSSVTLTASNVTDTYPYNGGGIVLEVAFYAQINGVNTLLGYGSFAAVGTWTLTFTDNLAPGSYTVFAVAQDNYGATSDPFTLTMTTQ
jgi:uncharacterized delta-60 repeat protein